jgi:cytochrome c-type biogenesis protein CcmH
MKALLGAVLMLWLLAPAWALSPGEVLDDPALEQRARAISKDLRCLVCQNQTIDDSDAPLARDLRLLVRERLLSGDSDREAIDFVVARYGEYVLLRPVIGAHTVLLWAAPVLFLLVGGTAILVALRRRRGATPAPTAAELAAAARLRDRP